MLPALKRYISLFLLFACMSFAANVHGIIKDTSGAVVPGALVLLSANSQPPRQTQSSTDGSYQFDAVSAGQYTLTASADQLALQTPIKIEIANKNLTVILVLAVVGKTENVNVASGEDRPTVTIDPSNNASAVTLKGEQLKALADNPEDLQSDLQALAGPGAGPGGGAVYIDGFSTGQVPPKESIQEVHVNENPFSPEFDKLGLGRVEIITKPGSQNWHGSVGFNFADDIWNARNPYAASKAPLRLVESENLLEGPLGKKASFSLDVERHSAAAAHYPANRLPIERSPDAFFPLQQHDKQRPAVWYRSI
jgi:Carboxypeptidase regulatory-like domain